MTASLRSICATIQDLHTFFTDTRVVAAGVDLREPVEALREKVVDTARSFMDGTINKFPVMSEKRLAWDEQQAKALEKELRTFSELMNRAIGASPKVNDVVTGYAVSKLTTGIVKHQVSSVLNATGPRNPGPYREYPFGGIVNKAEITGPTGRAGTQAAAALNA